MAEFSAATYEEAVQQAERALNTRATQMEIHVLQEGKGGLFKKPWVISAQVIEHIKAQDAPVAPAPAKPQHHQAAPNPAAAQAHFQVTYTQEGVMLACSGPIEDAEILRYCLRRGISGADITYARAQIAHGKSPAVLAPPQQEGPPAGEDVAAVVSKDEMQAYMILYPGDPGGEKMSVDKALGILQDAYKITYGIDRSAVERALSAGQYRQHVQVASGREAENGTDAKVEFHFRLTNSMRPKILEGNRVDYRTLELFESARKGQVLVTRTPPTPGVEGASVTGRVLKPRGGKDAQMPRGKGVTISEDRQEMTSQMDGMVALVNDQVIVTSRYVVEGDLDMGVGNLDFAGDIEVRGNVIQGMTVKAQGSVEIHGVAEAATIIAGGNVVLRQGMQGNDRGEVRAGGDVIAKYFERARVFAGGMVTADAIYHCEINAAQGVTAAGKLAQLIGGTTRSASTVVAKFIGSSAHVTTVVEVGILPEQRERFNFLQAELRRLQVERDKLALMVKSFADAPAEGEPPKRAELRARVMASDEHNTQSLLQAQAEYEKLKADMEAVTGGRVHVLGTVYPGVRVLIGSSTYLVDAPIDFATFRMEDKEVVFRACEYK